MTLESVALFNPRLEDWDHHFKWSQDLFFVEAKTASAGATMELLMLNRKGLVNLRKALAHFGVHPPSE